MKDTKLTVAQKEATVRYIKKNYTTYSFRLHNIKNQETINYLASIQNKQKFIVELIEAKRKASV